MAAIATLEELKSVQNDIEAFKMPEPSGYNRIAELLKKHRKRKIRVALAGLLFLAALLLYALYPRSYRARVVGVVDGDTLDVLAGQRQVRLRLVAIDCPEAGQPFGTAARKRSAELAFNKEVLVTPRSMDRYGRVLAVVTLPGGEVLNETLVREGFAFWYRRYAPHDDSIRNLESLARQEGRGVWSEKNVVYPWDYRAHHGGN